MTETQRDSADQQAESLVDNALKSPESASETAAGDKKPSRIARRIIAAVSVAAVAALGYGAFQIGVSHAAQDNPSAVQVSQDSQVEPAPVDRPIAFDARDDAADRDADRAALAGVTAQVAQRQRALDADADAVTKASRDAALKSRKSLLNTSATAIRVQSKRLTDRTLFFRPTAGDIGSKWGMRFHPILHYTRMHNGLDIGGNCGQPIYAAQDGIVTKVGTDGGSGNNIRIDHGTIAGKKVETGYLHMESFSVKVGDHVTRGQLLGYVGSTGLSTACHLHFALYENGKGADPMPYIKK